MIRRTTPNKTFFREDRLSSCCKWFASDEDRHEKTLTLEKRPPPARFSNRASTAFHRDQIPEVKGYQTPIKLNYPTRKSSGNSNEVSWPTARTTVQPPKEAIIIFPASQAARNPLQRLHKLHKNKNRIKTTERLTIQIATTSQPISFNYVTPRKQTLPTEEWSTAAMPPKPTQQLQPSQSYQLTKQIEEYRREYEELLNQYSQLKQKRETNLHIYRALLAKLAAKKEEIKALQKLRRQEIQELKTQIEQFIASRQQSLDLA